MEAAEYGLTSPSHPQQHKQANLTGFLGSWSPGLCPTMKNVFSAVFYSFSDHENE
jgi:hypothetical protein